MGIQQKTGHPVRFEITADVRASLIASLGRRGGTIDDFALAQYIREDRRWKFGGIGSPARTNLRVLDFLVRRVNAGENLQSSTADPHNDGISSTITRHSERFPRTGK
jgi:hypothetical protein